MSNELQAIFYGLTVFVLLCGGIAGLCLWLDRSADDDLGWSGKQAEKLQRQANKEFKQRQRLRVVRFWNF